MALPPAISFLLGCSVPASRALQIDQHKQDGDPRELFEVDTTRLPAGAIQKRTTNLDAWGRPTDLITLKPGVPVRVILIPASQPSRATQP